ncbi:haloacid dehalogenase type II [Streptomyces sp. PA03-1a]|nr:haloacid dehalogenase type II [Streptomyces sp. PA03-1a]
MEKQRTSHRSGVVIVAVNRIGVIVFDVNETLSDMTPLGDRFADVGASADLLPTWFAGILRDGFALTAAGGYADFSEIATENARALLTGLGDWTGDAEVAAHHLVEGFAALTVHPDVPEGVQMLHAAGYRLLTMTNGSQATTQRLLDSAGLLEHFDALLDVSGPRCWKPSRDAYLHATDTAGVRPAEAMLVAVHPWDVDGARRAGLAGAWLRRGRAHYPEIMTPANWEAASLTELAEKLPEARR